MMKRTDTWVAMLVTPALCLGFVSDSRAELIDRGTYDGVKLIYDSAQRITWLGDANWAKTSGFDPNGEMTWDEARAWAGGLTIGGFSDWRLPITSDETCRGAGCTNSEMGHLFAVEGVSSTNPGPFLNVQGRQYWSSRSYSSEPDLAWYVHFGNGDQAVTGKSDSHMPWAVRDGDVGSEVSNDTKPGSFLVRVHLGSHGFCPGMGRHYTNLLIPTGGPAFSRQPGDTGTAGAIFGEAAGKLIFIEYVLGQADLISGMSWPAIPLDGLPIPPIDNIHVLHFGTDESTTGRYTVHMYFLPEEVYLGWEAEPESL